MRDYLVRAPFEQVAVGKIARLIAQLFMIMQLTGTVFGTLKLSLKPC